MSKILAIILLCAVVHTYQPYTGRVMVTADHLGNIPGYTKVYSDPKTDYGVYVKDSYVATGCACGDVVGLVDTIGTVESTKDREFSVKVENISKIVPGVSGSPVYHNGRPIGFISGWDGTGLLRCIYY